MLSIDVFASLRTCSRAQRLREILIGYSTDPRGPIVSIEAMAPPPQDSHLVESSWLHLFLVASSKLVFTLQSAGAGKEIKFLLPFCSTAMRRPDRHKRHQTTWYSLLRQVAEDVFHCFIVFLNGVVRRMISLQ